MRSHAADERSDPGTSLLRGPLIAGALAGVVGGLVFGLMMAMTMPEMIGMIGSLVGAPGLGWVVHLTFSAIIGVGFGLALGRLATDWARSAGLGLGYGALWWVLGPLLLMPIWMGMGPMFAKAFEMPNLMSLMGHLFYGLVTGVVYRALTREVG